MNKQVSHTSKMLRFYIYRLKCILSAENTAMVCSVLPSAAVHIPVNHCLWIPFGHLSTFRGQGEVHRHIVINNFYRKCDSPLRFIPGPTHVHFPLTLLKVEFISRWRKPDVLLPIGVICGGLKIGGFERSKIYIFFFSFNLELEEMLPT